ncbi:hypothetical protein BDK51DRAFT_27600, partial [Blyttiomyces helicus]
MFEAHHAVPLAGAVLVPLNIRLSPPEITSILAASNARILFVDRELYHLAAGARVREVIVLDESGNEASDPYEQFLRRVGGRPSDWHEFPGVQDEGNTISVNYTSGTTGKPKGVMYSHRGAYLAAMSNCMEAGLTPDSTYIWTLPMFHCNGWCFTWATVAAGCTNVMVRK